MHQILLKCINQEITIILLEKNTCEFNSFVSGYHFFMVITKKSIGDTEIKNEKNEHDQLDIGNSYNNTAVYHIPKHFHKVFTDFFHRQAALFKLKSLTRA